MSARHAVTTVVAAAMTAAIAIGCRRAPASPPAPPAVPLHLAPACDLVPAAGLGWVVEVKPRALAQVPDLIPAIARVLPEERFRAYAAAHGGIDLRQIEDLCVARFRESLLAVARVPLDPARVDDAFERRATKTTTRTKVVANPVVTRLSTEVHGESEQLVIFGRDALALEQGRPGPLRAAEAFALGRLRRASPALRGAALARAAEVLGPAPVRVFAPGPFEGELARGLGGLLRASTAVAMSATPVEGSPRLAVRLVLTGAWGADAPAAAERLAAAVHVFSESAVGKLLGIDRPIEGPRVREAPEALIVEATIDANALAAGVHDAVDAEVGDIMRR